MKKTIYGILKGEYLLDEGAHKKWSFIMFFSLLALIVIASSHNTDGKVYKIAKLNEDVKALRSKYVNTRAQLMQLKMESFLKTKMKERDLFPSETPPFKVMVVSKTQIP